MQNSITKTVADDPQVLALSVHNLLIGTNLQAKVVHDCDTLWRGVKATLKALDLLQEEL